VDSSPDNGGENPAERLNYFNYFTEVEDEFVRRRGKPLLISPMDWALVESWKSAGIPLYLVLRAINEAFDAYDARPHRYRKINSVFYCQQAVEGAFAEYRQTRVGSGSPSGGQIAAGDAHAPETAVESPAANVFSKDVLLEFIARSDLELKDAEDLAFSSRKPEAVEAIARARSRLATIAGDIASSSEVDAEALERDLDAIDRMIVESLTACGPEDEIANLRAEAESQLRSYRKKMDKTIYEQTVANFVSRRLREINRIPRLSLFYL